MSDTGFRGLMARFFGAPRETRESETRQSLKRAAGVTPTEQQPSPAGTEVDRADVRDTGARGPAGR